MIRINHTADLHYRPSRAADCFASLATLEAESVGVDLSVIAGDLHDYPIQNTGASLFPELVKRLVSLADRSPVVMVQGTPTHDPDGGLDVYEKVSSRITVLRTGHVYFLVGERVIDGSAGKIIGTENARAIIFGLPEPQKKHLIAAGSDVPLGQAVRSVLLGYGAIRAQYPHLPCLLVYHGQVTGARMANGESAEGGVSIDALALVGADYIAMGDIHVPQRVGASRGLEAYYAGAAHPNGDWKDAGFDFGFNQVTIDGHAVTVARKPYPHPSYLKVEITYGDEWSGNVAGRRVWLEVTVRKSDAGLVDPEGLLARLYEDGAMPGSRVTVRALPDETVRTADIATCRRLRDKFAIYMRNSGREAMPEALEACDEIEAAAAGQGLAAMGGRFTFDRLVLRGARGIWSKRRVDEITLDLTAFDAGIVALVGPNGHGKTTLIDAFHIWTEFPSRPGPAHGNFRLKDSLWEVYATDHETGRLYRKRIVMDPTLKQPKAEYWLDSRANEFDPWEPVPGITGRLADYESTVAKIFGSFELYIRTAYQMQSPTDEFPDISKATRATKKQIMAALTGLDYYDAYKSIAEGKRKAFESEARDAQTRANAFEDSLRDIKDLEDDVARLEESENEAAKTLNTILAAGRAAKEEVAKLEEKDKEQRARTRELEGISRQIKELEDRVFYDGIEIDRLRQSLEMKPVAQEKLDRHDFLKQEESRLVVERNKELEALALANDAYRSAREKYDAQIREIDRSRDASVRDYTTERTALLHAMDLREAAIKSGETELLGLQSETCPTCGQSLPADAIARIHERRSRLTEAVTADRKKNEDTLARIRELDTSRDAAAAAFDALYAGLVTPIPPTPPESSTDERLRVIRSELYEIDVSHETDIVNAANMAEAKIAELSRTIEVNRGRIRSESERAATIEIDPTTETALSEMHARLESLRAEHTQKTAELERIRTDLEHATRAIRDHEKTIRTITDLHDKVATAQADAALWQSVETACGQNGIPALEIDAVCPTIAAVASTLLREYEDGRYSIRFETSRDGKKGNQIEDFLIMVVDSKDGAEQEFRTLSGGEAAWIRKALQDAFGIIRGQNSGVHYLTGFLDESDSALFPEARIAYFRMLASAHGQSVRRHTVMVTHSPELQAMIPQKIEVDSL